jgi:hypothetical protein
MAILALFGVALLGGALGAIAAWEFDRDDD